ANAQGKNPVIVANQNIHGEICMADREGIADRGGVAGSRWNPEAQNDRAELLLTMAIDCDPLSDLHGLQPSLKPNIGAIEVSGFPNAPSVDWHHHGNRNRNATGRCATAGTDGAIDPKSPDRA
ncbi:MAG: hypothetical protein VKL01_01170, partial [Limnothrix sp.]|nr:hypothetical protein [Limnothrix sp.]